MNGVPFEFCDKVCGFLDNNSTKEAARLTHIWSAAAGIHAKKRRSLNIEISQLADDHWGYICEDYCRQNRVDWSLGRLDLRYTRFEYVRVSSHRNEPGMTAISSKELIERLAPLIAAQMPWKNRLEFTIEDRNQAALDVLETFRKCAQFDELQIAFLGPESATFVKEKIASNDLRNIALTGSWPIEEEISGILMAYSKTSNDPAPIYITISSLITFPVFKAVFETWKAHGNRKLVIIGSSNASIQRIQDYVLQDADVLIARNQARISWTDSSDRECVIMFPDVRRPI